MINKSKSVLKKPEDYSTSSPVYKAYSNGIFPAAHKILFNVICRALNGKSECEVDFNEDKILYVGEIKNLAQRFNHGYGKITATNCYIGGTISNCRMNKVLLEFYECGKIIRLYFYQTRKYKSVDKNILRAVKTPYNIKSN